MSNYSTFGRPKLVSRLLALGVFWVAQLISYSALAVVVAVNDVVSVPLGTASFVYCHQNNDSLNGHASPLVTEGGFYNVSSSGPISGASLQDNASCSDAPTPAADTYNAFQITLTPGALGMGTIVYGIKDGSRGNFDIVTPLPCFLPGNATDSCGDVTIEVVAVTPTVTSGATATAIDENSGAGQVIYTVTGSAAIGGDPAVVSGLTPLALVYSFAGGVDDTLFAIDAANGQVRLLGDPDAEVKSAYSFAVRVNYGGISGNDSASKTVTLAISDLNDNDPVPQANTVTVLEGASVDETDLDTGANLLQGLTDADLTDSHTVNTTPVSDTTNGALTLSADGTFDYTHDGSENFSDSFTYEAIDAGGNTGDATVTITVTPQNDNAPALTADGTNFVADGVEYDEGANTAGSKLTIALDSYFIDLDIDEDGVQDASVSGDNDGLVYSVTGNSNSVLITTEINSGNLIIYSPEEEHGTADLTVTATDTAEPLGNISSVDLNFTVTVNSVNDAPTYISDSYSATGYTVDEDSGDISLPLAAAFTDLDIVGDSNSTDDSLTYTITVVDVPANDAVETVYVDLPFTIISDVDTDLTRTTVYETTDTTMVIELAPDGHGYLDITVRATDQGRPPAAPSDPVFLYDEETFRITVQGTGNDTPLAEDDHYSNFVELVMEEDAEPIIFDVLSNDYLGDVPSFVISAGETISDSGGVAHTWRTTSRLTDRNNVGDFAIEINGEVSCANAGCQDDQTVDTTIAADGILDNSVMYKPGLDFNGEDTFTYCIQDSFPASEPAFTPPNDVRCATVTVNVTPVNDLPRVPANIIYRMDQGDDLIVAAADGLATKVTGVDNTHIDGLGCNPTNPGCVPTPGRSPDTLYFSINSFTTDDGLVDTFNADGTFTYRPLAAFSGSDGFVFNVCETPVPSVDTCIFDVPVTIVVDAIEGASAGLSDEVVEVDFDLADLPLELPVGPEANVLIVNDDSGSMGWDILTNQSSGVFFFSTGNYIRYVMKATAGSSTYVAPGESDAPGEGLWRLRNSDYNKTYYNPTIRYDPWEGLNPDDVDFPDSVPARALHNPLAPSGDWTNLRSLQNYTGRAVKTTVRTCSQQCRRYRRGRCIRYRTVCTGGGSGFQQVNAEDLYLPRYYIWDNKDLTETTPDLDAMPSPIGADADDSDGILVEIRPASEMQSNGEPGSDTYPRPEGRTDCVAAVDSCSFDEEIQNFANWFTYSRNREFTAKSALGKVVAGSENIRVGYAKLNRRSDGQPIRSMNTSERTGSKADLLNTIYQTQSSGGTPLRRSLRDAGRHFACRDNDIFGSSSNSSPGDANCPVFDAPAGNCQQNFALLISDGAWNGSSPYVNNDDDDNNTNFDGGMYAASYSNSLADVAMQYYESDLHSSLLNEVPTSSRDTDGAADDAFEDSSNVLMHQHMKTFTVGFGVNGLIEEEDVPTDYTQPFVWGSPTNTERKIDDMRHAAVNGRGQYLSAGNAATLADALVSAFEEFQQGSGAASAVSFNSQEILEDTLVFRSFYNTKNNTGDLLAQEIDSDGVVTVEPVWNAAARLDEISPANRVILTYDRYKPPLPDVNPTLAQGIPFRGSSLNVNQRTAFSSEPPGALQDLEVNQGIAYLRGDHSNERPTGNFRERPGIEGRLGDIVHSAPTFIGPPSRLSRDSVPFPQDNGELYSQFRLAYKDRDPLVYVAANDGMLHGFDAETGDEVLGYLPSNLMTNTYSQAVTDLLDFQYTHKYFVDSTPAVEDVYMDADGDGQKEWRTILVSGQGGGGKAYFALDITDPTKFSDLTAEQVVLWEFTDEDDTYPTDEFGDALLADTDGDGVVDDQRQDLLSPARPAKDLGYTTSVPTLVMSNIVESDGENKWVAITGNGYNSTAGIAKLLILFLEGGLDSMWCHPDINHNVTPNGAYPNECLEGDEQDFVKLDTGFGVESGLPNGLGEPRVIDADGNGTADYVYAGDLQGNFFRFDITDADFNQWSVTKIFKAQYKPGTADEKNQPITTQPIVIVHPTEEEGYIVIFATGAYLRTGDSTDSEIQSIYGLWDRLGPGLIQKSDLQVQSYTNVSDAFGKVRTLSDDDVDYSVSVVGAQRGWYNDLDAAAPGELPGSAPEFPGERAVRNIQLRGGLAFVNSIFPREVGSCVGRAGGATLAFCPDTGGSLCLGERTVFDLDNDGEFDADDDIVSDSGRTAAGIILEDPAPPTDSTFIENKRVTQYGRELHIIGTNTSTGENTGRLSWKRLETID